MSYVDAILSSTEDKINVIERTSDGKRLIQEYPTKYVLYYQDTEGKHRSIYGDPVTRVTTRKRNEFERERRIHSDKKLFESDINVVFRCLSDNYLGVDEPKLHTCFLDIESDWDIVKGFAPPEDPFNAVTAITVYLDWLDQCVTLVIPPKDMSDEDAELISKDFTNCFLFRSEIEMFEIFFDLIEDADVLTGWNSEGYDLPYMVNRVTRIMSKNDTRRFCLLDQLPKVRSYERFGKEQKTYDLVGRVHMDYLQLYKKFNYESRHSYSLDAIGEMEVNERKTQYEGSLDQLYNKDFRKFIEYNRQDTMLMVKIHNKLQFLDLANVLAHENSVLIPDVMGTVRMTEMAIFNEAKSLGVVLPDREKRNASTETQEFPSAGGFVAIPKIGLQEYVGVVDITSLYPSDIRALNMSPETLIAQVRQTLTDQYMSEKSMRLAREKKNKKKKKFGDDSEEEGVTGSRLWEGLFASLEYTAIMNKERGTLLWVDYEDGRSIEMSAAEIHKMIFDSNSPWILSANGTIFTYEREGIIPRLLTRWFTERKAIQDQAKAAYGTPEYGYYDKRQLVKKINLNATFGAILNEYCRFYDKRIGQSITLTGRQIVKHMMSQINETITGEYSHTGDAVIAADTDSTMFTAYTTLQSQINSGELNWSKEMCIELYDNIADQANQSFPDFMYNAFHCPKKNGKMIKAGRELVGDRAIFVARKRYAINIFDKEGKRTDKDGQLGQIKAMGLDLKRADTPKYIQQFLMEVLCMVIQEGKGREEVITKIKDFKRYLSEQDSWDKGSPKAVNNLTKYTKIYEKTGKCGVGHVMAAINYNRLRKMHNDNFSQPIVDGTKIVVCTLKSNPLGMTTVAAPVDETRLPSWFLDLPFNDLEMERKLVDVKIDNLLGVLNWNINTEIDVNSTFNTLFSIS